MSVAPDAKSTPTTTPRGPPKIQPLVKRRPHRRSPQACDECRLRKRACDAVEPCAPCRRGGLNCTYAFRRPAPPPTSRIRELQDHLRLAKTYLQSVKDHGTQVPGLDLDECLRTLDFTLPEPGDAPSPTTPKSATTASSTWSAPVTPKDATSTSSLSREKHGNMLTGCSRFATSEPTYSSYYGAFSDVSFLMRTMELFHEVRPTNCGMDFQKIQSFFTLPFSFDATITENSLSPSEASYNVPPLSVALQMPQVLLSFVSESYVAELTKDLNSPVPRNISALVQSLRALGCLTDTSEHQRQGCQKSWDAAHQHFLKCSNALLPIPTDSVISLQAFLCASVYLLSTSRVTAAHSMIGNACSIASRLGMLTTSLGPPSLRSEDRITWTQTFASLVTLDSLTSLILDLPPQLSQDTVSEHRIIEIATEAEHRHDYRTAAVLRQASLVLIPVAIRKRSQREVINTAEEARLPGIGDITLLESAHAEFRRWKREVSPLLTSLGSSKEEEVIKRDLEMAFNFCQIIIFRSHLHHLRSVAVGGSMSKTQSYHALACLKLATSTIVNADRQADGPQSHLLKTSWLAIYTIFSAVSCLVFLIAAHPGTARPSVAWQRAYKGIRILTKHACGSNLAAACLEVLKIVTTELSHTVYFDYDEIEASTTRVCESSVPSRQHSISFPVTKDVVKENPADWMLSQAEALAAEFDFRDILNLSDSE